jgi:hypothetical protein
MKDFLIFSLPGLLSASKRTQYRKNCRDQARSLLGFIVSNGLVRPDRTLPPVASDDLVIMASDLTDEGLAAMREALRKWVAAQDRGAPANDLTILESALAKIRGGS